MEGKLLNQVLDKLYVENMKQKWDSICLCIIA